MARPTEMTHTLADSTRRRYMLRRTLFPWKPRETIDEVISFCREYGVDEVVWKIDTEEFSHGIPTLDRIRTYVPWLNESRERLEKTGVVMSINPWVTVGMRDAGWDLRTTFPEFDWLTDIDGTETKSQACPLNPAFQEWLASAYELYASTGPRLLWIEDDIRVQNHRPARFTCFCPKHREAFSRITGRNWSRDQLREEILRPGEPSPVRTQWIDFVGGVIAEVIELLSARIHGRFPGTQLALMCSSPAMHATEHRDWDRIMKAVAGPHPFVVIRPCMGNYSEVSPQGLYGSRQRLSSTMKCVRLPVHSCTEIENWPFSRFSKSARFTRAQLLLSASLRCQSMTLNLYDHVGTPLAEEPQYGEALRSTRAPVDALVALCPPDATERGFGMLHPEDGPKHKRLAPGAIFGDIAMGEENWAMPLQALGLSVTWQPSPVVAVTGSKLEAYSRPELEVLFSRGVLLDLSALESLEQMGLAKELAGVTVERAFRRIERETPAEELVDPSFGGPGRYMTVDHIPLRVRIGQIRPEGHARVISQLVNPDRERVLPAFVLFENKFGGRVAVCPYDLNEEVRPWFLNWHRQRQLKAVADWLFREQTPLQVDGGAYPLAIRTDTADSTVVSIFNLSQDPWPRVEVRMHWTAPGAEVARLQSDGSWRVLPPADACATHTNLSFRSSETIDPLDLAAFRIRPTAPATGA
jgi:hypothetical protein